MQYRRAQVCGGNFFFTVVTNQRREFLTFPLARAALREAFDDVRLQSPFVLEAIVLLPEHFHMMIVLPGNSADFSSRVGKIKSGFTQRYLAAGGREGGISAGRARKGYRGIWQPRFWEHTIRDARDHKMHLDYLHANPLKHGLVKRVIDWPWSSFHRYVAQGEYEPDWAGHVSLPHDVEYYWAD